MSKKYITLDSGKRHQEDSGYQRDTQDGKPRFNLLFLKGISYDKQPLKLFADLLSRGAEKYTERNWEIADSEEALERAKESLLRHTIQAITEEVDEDHLSAICFNAFQIRSIQYKLRDKQNAVNTNR